MITTKKSSEKSICFAFIILLAAVLIVVLSAGFAYAADGSTVDKLDFNKTIAYMITSAISFLLFLGYCAFVKKKELVFILLFASVLLINLGYAFLSSSQTLSEALLANKITYLGAVFLPLFMLVIIMDECHYKRNKVFLAVLLCINLAVLYLTMTPGHSPIYYADVELGFVNGGATLIKTYGPLHSVYLYFLILYFVMMIFFIVYAFFKKEKSSSRIAVSLLIVVFGNILVWFIEQKITLNFEFLSVSYIITELYLLSLYSLLNSNYISAAQPVDTSDSSSEPSGTAVTFSAEEAEAIIASWPAAAQLTSREHEVLKYLLANKKRKNIAEDLCVSENTVKKHTSNIFAKLEVSSRAEIIEKLSQLK